MSAAYRVLVGSLAIAGWTGVGCFLWAMIAPGQERIVEMRTKAAKENPVIMSELRQQNELVLKVLKEAAETNENIASKPNWTQR